jgi:hypothetical protein
VVLKVAQSAAMPVALAAVLLTFAAFKARKLKYPKR